MKRNYPRQGQVYTLAQILNELELRDSPALGCTIAGVETCINDSHVTTADMLAVPKAAESRWKYRYETDEWIPVFQFVGPDNGVLEFCDVALNWDWLKSEYQEPSQWDTLNQLWVTPKGHPRPQYGEPTEYGGATTLEKLLEYAAGVSA